MGLSVKAVLKRVLLLLKATAAKPTATTLKG